MATRTHTDALEVDAALARRLLAAQFPAWAGLPLEAVEPRGTDNALYRLGARMVVRLPQTPRTAATLLKEREWLPRLASSLPLAAPTPVADGAPAEGYPLPWSVYEWLEGEDATVEPIADQARAAWDLAEFVTALQRLDTAGGPGPGAHNFFRGEPLAGRGRAVHESLDALRDEIDVDAAAALWESALAAPAWPHAPVWIHGDLDARNLLVSGGLLSAVIDWGGLGVGDPACDVMVAWKLFSRESRAVFRAALDVDDATWARAHGWALSQALGALAYYTPDTNAVLLQEAQRWLAEVLAEGPA